MLKMNVDLGSWNFNPFSYTLKILIKSKLCKTYHIITLGIKNIIILPDESF